MRLLNTTSRKVLGAVLGVLVVLCAGGIAWLHRVTLKDLQHGTQSRLGGITATMATQIDGARITRLLNKYPTHDALAGTTKDPYFYVLHENLRRCAELNELEAPLVITAFDQEQDELITVVSSVDAPVFRKRYEGPGAVDLIAYFGADRIDVSHARADDALLSFTALRDDHGRITGAITAWSSEPALIAVARGKLWRNIGIALLVLVAAGFTLFRSVGRWVQVEEEQRADWQRRHEGMTDSIAYARKLQGAMIPKPEALADQFTQHFVFNRPRDVVSGDFHWMHRLDDDRCLIAVADCTGHGVPGAMMATLCCSLLNEVVLQDPWRDPAEILHQLNLRLIQSLHQQGQRKGAGDGMDIALCRVDRYEREVVFAGAFRPLYWIHDGQLTVINGDRKPIGGSHFEPERKFTAHRIAYHEGDRIYLFSDGYVDQFGGPDRKKFMVPRFNALLLGEQHLDMPAQSELLARAFDEWRGGQEQVDDVCVLGLQLRA